MGVHRLRRSYRRWLPLALGLTAAANLVIGAYLPISAQPFRLHDDESLTHLVHTEQVSLDRRYGIYMELGDAMAGGMLYVPEGSVVNADLARGLSNVIVFERGYDPKDFPSDVIPDDEPLGLFETGEGDLAYWVLPGADDVRWWLARSSEGVVIIPESVAPVPEETDER